MPESQCAAGPRRETWGFSLNATWSPGGAKADGLYLFSGVGADILEGRLTETGIVYYPPFCDPWWWWCVPGGFGPGTVVKGKKDETALAWNAGIGYSWNIGRGSILFLEARYKYVDTDRQSTESIPVVLGIRW